MPVRLNPEDFIFVQTHTTLASHVSAGLKVTLNAIIQGNAVSYAVIVNGQCKANERNSSLAAEVYNSFLPTE